MAVKVKREKKIGSLFNRKKYELFFCLYYHDTWLTPEQLANFTPGLKQHYAECRCPTFYRYHYIARKAIIVGDRARIAYKLKPKGSRYINDNVPKALRLETLLKIRRRAKQIEAESNPDKDSKNHSGDIVWQVFQDSQRPAIEPLPAELETATVEDVVRPEPQPEPERYDYVGFRSSMNSVQVLNLRTRKWNLQYHFPDSCLKLPDRNAVIEYLNG